MSLWLRIIVHMPLTMSTCIGTQAYKMNISESLAYVVPTRSCVGDVFAGVGPFSIPLAKRKCNVHANDINPIAYSALIENSSLNNVQKNVTCYNLDGREFLLHLYQLGILCDVVIMNLPRSAPQFLDVFHSISLGKKQPIIHCYAFSKVPDAQDALTEIQTVLGRGRIKNTEVHVVKDVSPTESLLCISFKLV